MRVTIPEGYREEGGIAPLSLETPFGDYRLAVRVQGEEIFITRRFCLKKGTYPRTDYDKFKDFITKVQLADRSRMVLVKNE